jgi:hypothetical protein
MYFCLPVRNFHYSYYAMIVMATCADREEFLKMCEVQKLVYGTAYLQFIVMLCM